MRGGIDTAGEPARYDQPARTELTGQRPGSRASAAGGRPGSDDGDLGAFEDSRIAAAVEYRRRTGDGGKPFGIAGRSDRHDRYAAAPERVSLPADGLPVDTAEPVDRGTRESQCRELAIARLEQPADTPERRERAQDCTPVARPCTADREPRQDIGVGRGGWAGFGHSKDWPPEVRQ